MLHILLLILKITGIILAVILGILVLLVCIVIFVPVRYEINGRCKKILPELKAKGKVTWLFGLVRADIYYKENKLKWRFRVAWKKFYGGQKYGAEDPDTFLEKAAPDTADTQNKRTEGEEDEDEKRDEEAWERHDDYEEGSKEAWSAAKAGSEAEKEIWEAGFCESKKDAEIKESYEKSRDQSGSGKEDSEDVQSYIWEDEEIYEEIFKGSEKKSSGDEEGAYESRSAYEEPDREDGGFISGIIRKIKGIYSSIKCTIQNICDKIKALLEKKNRILSFIRDEAHVGAFRKAKKEAFKLLRKLRPKKFLLEARFGFEDPSLTGRTVAAIAPFYPFFGEAVLLKPDFTNKVLEGKLYAKGRIRFCHFLALLWNLFWSRDVRRTYQDIRNFKL